MLYLPAGAKYLFFQAAAHGQYWRLKTMSCRACLFFYYFFGNKKQLLKALLICTFIHLLLNLLICLAAVQNQGRYTLRLLCCSCTQKDWGKGFLVFLRDQEGVCRKLLSVPEVWEVKYRSEFKHNFTNPAAITWRRSVKKVF